MLLRDGKIVTSALVTIKPNAQAQRDRLASLRRDPSLADDFDREHCHLDEGPESFGTITKAGLRDLITKAEEQALPHKMPVATVGAQPGHAGHPAQLLPRAPPTAATAPKVAPLVKDDVAKVEIASAPRCETCTCDGRRTLSAGSAPNGTRCTPPRSLSRSSTRFARRRRLTNLPSTERHNVRPYPRTWSSMSHAGFALSFASSLSSFSLPHLRKTTRIWC